MNDIIGLLLHAIPAACIAWTVTHEELFREVNTFCSSKSKESQYFVVRKFFYLFTCEYCFSHYISAGIIVLTDFKMIYTDWRGYLLSFFSIVFVANVYMNLYQRTRVEIRKEKAVADNVEKQNKDDTPLPDCDDQQEKE